MALLPLWGKKTLQRLKWYMSWMHKKLLPYWWIQNLFWRNEIYFYFVFHSCLCSDFLAQVIINCIHLSGSLSRMRLRRSDVQPNCLTVNVHWRFIWLLNVFSRHWPTIALPTLRWGYPQSFWFLICVQEMRQADVFMGREGRSANRYGIANFSHYTVGVMG